MDSENRRDLKFKLYYFNTRGRAEPIRVMLHYCGQEFEDIRFNVSDWDDLKGSMPQETVPILEVNGKKLPQSRAIMRYLGRLFDLTGKNHWERAIADSIVDLLADFYTQMLPWYSNRLHVESDPDLLLKLREEKLIPAVESKFPYFVDYLKQAKSGFYVKSGITFVDFLCSELFDIVHNLEPDVFNPYPEIMEHIKRIHSLPQLQDGWIFETETMILLILLVFLRFVSSQIQCPDNVPYQSTDACDPDRQNPCDTGFRCRPGTVDAPATNSTTGPSQIRFLCCSSANMSISQYFIESGVSPTVVPIIPLTNLLGVIMRDNATGNLFNVDGIGKDLTVNVSNIVCNQNTVLPGGTFTQLDAVIFTFPPSSGEYLHFIVGLDNLLIPSAIFFYYNYPSFGEPVLNLTELEERYPRGYAEVIGNSSIPWETQYKTEFVVLVFKTSKFIDNTSAISLDINQSQGDLAHFLSTTPTGQLLGSPILGTMFRLRTPNTIFQTTNSSTPDPTQSCPSLNPLLFTLASIAINLLLK